MIDLKVLHNLFNESLLITIERKNSVKFKVNEKTYANLKTTLKDSFIYNDSDFEISFFDDTTDYYRDDNDILSKKNKINRNKDILLLDHNQQSVRYTFKDGKQSDNKFFITNVLAYNTLLELLKDSPITDLNITSEQKLLLFSNDYGILKIDYKSTIILELDENIDYQIQVKRFENELLKDEVLIEYIKGEVIKLLRNVSYNEQLNKLLISLDFIIDNANKEFKIYIKKFSFEKLKSQIITEKEKYFVSLREILSKIFTQIIAIPISVTVLVAAIENLNALNLIVLFLCAYFLVSLISIIVQVSYLFDLIDCNKLFIKEFKTIEKFSGIEQKDIDSERDKIIRRFILNYTILGFLFIITMILLAVAYFYGISRIESLMYNPTYL